MITFFEIVAKIGCFLFVFRPENIMHVLYNLTVGKNGVYIWPIQIYMQFFSLLIATVFPLPFYMYILYFKIYKVHFFHAYVYKYIHYITFKLAQAVAYFLVGQFVTLINKVHIYTLPQFFLFPWRHKTRTCSRVLNLKSFFLYHIAYI